MEGLALAVEPMVVAGDQDTVLLDDEPVCACLLACGQAEGRTVTTIEGLTDASDTARSLQRAFLRHGAAQCGMCTPGMIVAATALLERNAAQFENNHRMRQPMNGLRRLKDLDKVVEQENARGRRAP